MQTLRRSVLAASLMFGAMTPAAFAFDGTITFTGRISTQTCTISGNGGGNNFTVALPTVAATTLRTAGSVAGRTPFNIRLSGCTPDTGNVAVHFEPGTTVDTATGRLINTAVAIPEVGQTPGVPPATHVQVGLLNADMTDIVVGSAQAAQNSHQVALAGGAATLQYYAQYVATGGAATAGNLTTTATYTVVYP